MAGCGYVCPQCEGRGFTDDLKTCDYCSKPIVDKINTTITDEEWIKQVHEGPCCSGVENHLPNDENPIPNLNRNSTMKRR